ncbi:hypothetical protein HYH02_005556 [Chlamydomonas schloesseri]|uniref:Uncharacterized protein n=1 Tax=Chlamydomonas schloesseri TaxID=2026947 RepID=A0A836B6X0_9CHLO|nr:hypothetical protein HYH02_005556 [Chlamydomonas schloesseri]|eukprot:KAG2449407.1 hypothetical protein HYH02_005556 [Chlamydomonas schloesseri]
MFRARASGFFVGFGVAGVLAAYQLRQDILKSHEVLVIQADEYKGKLEKRVAALESSVSSLKAEVAEAKKSAAAATAAATAAMTAAASSPAPADAAAPSE